MNSLILPDWPLPPGVKACSTTRGGGGASLPPYDSLNLGTHVGDEEQAVKRNRERLVTVAGLPQMPVWLEQVHGTRVVTLTGHPPADLRADAVYSNVPGQVCAVMTADCLPVLFCSQNGDEVAAARRLAWAMPRRAGANRGGVQRRTGPDPRLAGAGDRPAAV